MTYRLRILKAFSMVVFVCLAALSPAHAALSWLGIPWWIWLLLGLALIVIFACVLTRPGEDSRSAEVETAPAQAAAPEAPPAVSAAAPALKDDLKRVEGIGPKISGLLNEAGILTFSDLAAADVGRLKDILDKAGLSHLADPGTWPQQANLAAAGRWDDLNALQDVLKGGRRT